MRRLPVSSVDEAISLSAGAVGQSYRGGRLGQESFVLDGMGVKNQLDASSNSLGIRVPTSMITEASLTTNAFSARYGQALSGVINVVTRDGGSKWSGQAAYESDRLMTGNADFGLDRLLLQANGPLFAGITFVGVVDATGRMDADPTSAPAAERSARSAESSAIAILPHNSGEQLDLAGQAGHSRSGRSRRCGSSASTVPSRDCSTTSSSSTTSGLPRPSASPAVWSPPTTSTRRRRVQAHR